MFSAVTASSSSSLLDLIRSECLADNPGLDEQLREIEDECERSGKSALEIIEKVWAEVEGARHNSCSPDNKYVVVDQAPETWWRGGKWRVAFYNRETGKTALVYSTREPLMPQDNQSRLHPDPHPHFVMNGRYIISTANNADGHMDLYLTPVDQLIEMTK